MDRGDTLLLSSENILQCDYYESNTNVHLKDPKTKDNNIKKKLKV